VLTRAKKTLNWLVFLSGILSGISALSILGAIDVEGSSFWTDWIGQGRWRFTLAWAGFGFVTVALSMLAVRNRKLAGSLFLIGAPILAFRTYVSGDDFTSSLAPVVLIAYLAIGVFWYRANHRKWPPLFSTRLSERTYGLATVLSATLVFLSLLTLGSAAVALIPTRFNPDCGGVPQPFTAPKYPGHAVFLATVPFVPLAVVHEHYWGLPPWSTKFALIARAGIGGRFSGENTYFLDMHRSTGLVTRFLPLVELNVCSGRSAPASAAKLDLRILRGAPTREGVRVIGQASVGYRKPLRGAKVLVTGPSGTTAVVTDQDGIYDLPNLPVGHYRVQLEGCTAPDRLRICEIEPAANFKSGDTFASQLQTGTGLF